MCVCVCEESEGEKEGASEYIRTLFMAKQHLLFGLTAPAVCDGIAPLVASSAAPELVIKNETVPSIPTLTVHMCAWLWYFAAAA